MTNIKTGKPTILSGCTVMPPMIQKTVPTTKGKENEHSKRTAATSNRFHEINSFVDCSMVDLTRAELGTWLVLWRDTKKGGTVRTSSNDIGRRIGVSRRAVTNALAGLRKRGLIRVIHQGGINSGLSVYCVQPLAKLGI